MLPLPRRWSTALLAAVLAAATLLGASLAAPSRVVGLGPLPACRYDDILTEPRGYDEWAITLVDTILRVTRAYVPPDLAPVSEAGIAGPGMVRAVAIGDLAALTEAAKAAGNPIGVTSAYRSYAKQVSTFQYWVNLVGRKQALLVSARPGHSEHQLGLAIDFKTAGGGSPFEGNWGRSPAGTWMRKHAWEFGWIQSYPKGKRDTTCYAYESWHFRYVGRDLAAAIHASGLTPREYLWRHYTTAVVPTGSPATPTPPPTARPTHPPSATPGSSPGVSPPSEPTASPFPPSALPTAAANGSAQPSVPGSVSPSVGPASPAGTGADSATVAALVGLLLGIVALAAVLLRQRRRAT